MDRRLAVSDCRIWKGLAGTDPGSANYTFRATGITAYPQRRTAAPWKKPRPWPTIHLRRQHSSTIADKTKVSLDEVERVLIQGPANPERFSSGRQFHCPQLSFGIPKHWLHY
jgi:hypothetical protein